MRQNTPGLGGKSQKGTTRWGGVLPSQQGLTKGGSSKRKEESRQILKKRKKGSPLKKKKGGACSTESSKQADEKTRLPGRSKRVKGGHPIKELTP